MSAHQSILMYDRFMGAENGYGLQSNILQGQGDKNRNLAASTDSKDALAPCPYGSLST